MSHLQVAAIDPDSHPSFIACYVVKNLLQVSTVPCSGYALKFYDTQVIAIVICSFRVSRPPSKVQKPRFRHEGICSEKEKIKTFEAVSP